MRRRAVPAALALVLACGGEEEMDWNPDVVRAVAARSAASVDNGMIVWRRVLVDDAAGPPLPWGAHQALITAGFLVVDSGAVRPDTSVLGFRSIRREDDRWLVETARQPPDGPARWIRWIVRCAPACVVTDSTPIAGTSGAGEPP